jgi:hypothetical protein
MKFRAVVEPPERQRLGLVRLVPRRSIERDPEMWMPLLQLGLSHSTTALLGRLEGRSPCSQLSAPLG